MAVALAVGASLLVLALVLELVPVPGAPAPAAGEPLAAAVPERPALRLPVPQPVTTDPTRHPRPGVPKPVAPTDLDRAIAAARQGDARAAHAAYRGLAACADADGPGCPGVPASLLQERRRFLAQAVAAGLPQAQVDFYFEGPDALQALDEQALQAWRGEALTSLQAAASACEPLAAGLLATLHDSGELAPRDAARAVAFAVAEGQWRQRPPSDAALRDRLGEPIDDAALAAARQQGLQLAAACR